MKDPTMRIGYVLTGATVVIIGVATTATFCSTNEAAESKGPVLLPHAGTELVPSSEPDENVGQAYGGGLKCKYEPASRGGIEIKPGASTEGFSGTIRTTVTSDNVLEVFFDNSPLDARPETIILDDGRTAKVPRVEGPIWMNPSKWNIAGTNFVTVQFCG